MDIISISLSMLVQRVFNGVIEIVNYVILWQSTQDEFLELSNDLWVKELFKEYFAEAFWAKISDSYEGWKACLASACPFHSGFSTLISFKSKTVSQFEFEDMCFALSFITSCIGRLVEEKYVRTSVFLSIFQSVLLNFMIASHSSELPRHSSSLCWPWATHRPAGFKFWP